MSEATYMVDLDEDDLTWWLCIGEADFGPYDSEAEAVLDGDRLVNGG